VSESELVSVTMWALALETASVSDSELESVLVLARVLALALERSLA
jgi:hypothetical protein